VEMKWGEIEGGVGWKGGKGVVDAVV
jgi:hypothetical protein